MMGPKKVTVRDVASLANVSPSTVSRVLNRAARVSVAIQERVQAAAAEVGFKHVRPNRAKVIAFLASNRDLLHPFHSRVLVGAEAYCAANDHSMLFLSLRYSPNVTWQEIHLPAILQRRDLISGFIVSGTNSQNLLDLLTRRQIPFAVLGNNVLGEWKSEDHDTVWFDDEQGAYEVTRYLQSVGHRDIWFAGNCKFTWFARLYEGYRHAMEEAGLAPRLSGFDSEQEENMGYLAAKSIFTTGESATAIFAGSELCAQGVYKALRDLRLRVPDDVSVVGSDDFDAGRLYPSLTTIRVFAEEVGKHLAELVLNRIAQPTKARQKCTIPTQIVKRESCQPLSKLYELPRHSSSQLEI
jgi:DNA-binding LacI/PurR family transcriptional regulator